MSSETNGAATAIRASARWPGMLRLGLDVLAGPVIALLNQQAIYAGNMWACGHNAGWSLHVAGALCLVAVLAVTIDSWAVWRDVGRGVEEEHEGVAARTRFLALVGMMVGAISIAVVLAEWLAVFVFGPCMRA